VEKKQEIKYKKATLSSNLNTANLLLKKKETQQLQNA